MDEILKCGYQMKATEQYFSVVFREVKCDIFQP